MLPQHAHVGMLGKLLGEAALQQPELVRAT